MMSFFILALAAVAGDPKQAFLDPRAAGIDFEIQGEYVGEIEMDGLQKFGVQVIALGDGEFLASGYSGGLPGDGWLGTEIIQAKGRLKDGTVRFVVPEGDGAGIWKDGVITVQNIYGQVLGELHKVERKSPTLGAQPPEGAIVLFDGRSVDAFQVGRMSEDGLLCEGAVSKQKFQDFTLHIEFRTPFQPFARGQARGNSGFYAQGRYEVQILDSFGLTGESNECGGIYAVARPKVNMCFPPLAWQTYDIEFTAARFENGKKVANARMTVRHNGVLIHDNVELPGPTRAAIVAEESPEPGPVYLQDHGNPVRFRNIWIVEKK